MAGELAGNTARDRRADAVLRGEGWRVLRFWEHEDPDAVVDAICAALAVDGRRRPARTSGEAAGDPAQVVTRSAADSHPASSVM